MKRKIEKSGLKGSITVEAAFLFPFLILLTCLLVLLTMKLYQSVKEQSASIYKKTVIEWGPLTPQRIRIVDTAFDFFDNGEKEK